ncbi:MAG: aspartate/glutamate racemase family protein [Alphaproteobacteria bacterium]|jgi:Asp/Glu/hydantoin racemase|nr:aspartate/glutamate racemase family protein [Alphaproteobacteria bacterium]
MIATGGQPIYGIDLGILMLDAQFPRILGDMGNARTWPFPVRYKIVRGASPEVVVLQGAEGTLDAFIEAGRELVAEGCRIITTNCGFLAKFQAELSTALGVPVATSALMQAAAIQAVLPPGRRVGILTISAATLTEAHLQAAGVPEGTPVAGIADGCEFQRAILGNALTLDVDQAEADLAAAARAFQAAHPHLGAILLECTNMPPYKKAIAEATGLPVFSIETYVKWLVESLPR